MAQGKHAAPDRQGPGQAESHQSQPLQGLLRLPPGQEQPPAGQAPSHQHQAEGQPQQQGGAQLSPIDRPPPQAEGELIFQGIRRAAIHKLHQQGRGQHAHHHGDRNPLRQA